MTETKQQTNFLGLCPLCGHRLILHGQAYYMKDQHWCMAYNTTTAKFCRCTGDRYIAPTQEEGTAVDA